MHTFHLKNVHCRYCSITISPSNILEIKRQPGVIVERWDGIDGYLVRKLLEDPRFPDMSTSYYYSSTFMEPLDWADDMYGSRIRGYFVPQQTGRHVFFIGI